MVRSSFPFKFGTTSYDLGSRTHLMGVLNVTPDSFSDGGKYFDFHAAIARAHEMASQGADLIDVGGESTRPGSEPLPADEEIRRVVPIIKTLVREIHVPLSIDTYKAVVADAALGAGAVIVNDISGLTFDPAMVDVVVRNGASVVIMHIKGTPKNMQENPQYDDVFSEIFGFLQAQCKKAKDSGIAQIIVDPGIGFGKKLEHNLQLIKRLGEFSQLAYPIMVGPSRKSFLGMLLNLPVNERIEGTAAAVTGCILNGAHLLRVHDVKEMKRVAVVADAIKTS